MFGAPVLALIISLRPFLSAADQASVREGSPWFLGCMDASSGLIAPEGARDLDPVTCCACCLAEGFQVAALTSESCYCGNQQHGLVAGECFNTSSSGETKDVGAENKRQSVLHLPFGDSQGSVALYRRKEPFLNKARKVQIYAEQQAYSTHGDVTLLAVCETEGPAEFLWDFGDSRSARTTSRNITIRYSRPGRYDVVVVMSQGWTSITSDAFPLVIQRAAKLNRLLHPASVLQHHTVTLSCRVSAGTDVNFLWSFGDGTTRRGQSAEQHVYHRTGEFIVEVMVSNLVSSTSLSSHIFVVDRPCQPPPVKNMGPLKLQVHRFEVIHLAVTYEAEVDCDISGGLRYSWSLFDSAGRVFPLPLVDTHRQGITLPGHLLHYDTYTAIAKVQVVGSVVYSNYSVRVQVKASPPVVIIEGGTNRFINRRDVTVVTLDARRSHDPDSPMNPLSFSWACKPVSSIPGSCFHQDFPSTSPVLKFPASILKHNFDQFQFTLTVHSRRRSASSEVFLTVTPNVMGKVSVSCLQCQGDQVNWDQPFSVSALCEGCNVTPGNIQYTWSLFLVNASSRPVKEVPFCFTVDLIAPSNLMEAPAMVTLPSPDADAYIQASVSSAETADEAQVTDMTTAGSGEEPFHRPLGEFDPPGPLYSSTEYLTLAPDNSGVLFSDHFGQSDVISDFPADWDSSADWDYSFPVLEVGNPGERPDGLITDYNLHMMDAEEGDPGISAGRPTGVDYESFGSGDDSAFDPPPHEEEGSNLVDSRPSVMTREQVLLDLPRYRLDGGVFESYTFTGVSSPSLSFRPFSLRPGSRYMLDVTAKSNEGILGRTQIFLKTTPAPKDVMCQVQPVSGVELFTHFSVFCTSGREDLIYEYSISVGNRPRRTLYQGMDFQYYFSLPSGDPRDNYEVTIYTEIRDGTHGSSTKPCPVTVRVQPSFSRDASSSSSHLNPDLELLEVGLKNLSALVQLRNSLEIRNYVSLLASILNRLSLDREADTCSQRLVRNVLICTTCDLESHDQASRMDSVVILQDLLHDTSQVTSVSLRRVAGHIHLILKGFSESSAPFGYNLDQKTLNTLVAVLSYSLQAAVSRDFTPVMSNSADVKQESDGNDQKIPYNSCTGTQEHFTSSKQAVQLVADILQTASDLMLTYIVSLKVQEHRVSTDLISLYASSMNQMSTVVHGGSTAFHLPNSLIQLLFSRDTGRNPACVLSVLTEVRHSLYTWANPKISGPVIDLSLYKCNTRRKIPVRFLIQPLDVVLQQPPKNQSSVREFSLLRTQINYHSFNITQEHLHQALQLTVVFTLPLSKAFPIMLLFRMFEKPSPSMHHLHKVHRWESNTTRFTLPPSYLSAAGIGHLALLNADFAKASGHKHLSELVNYSLTVDSSLCLSWDSHHRTWTHHGCRTQRSDSTAAVNCSCHQLRMLTVVQQQIHSSHDRADLDPFLSVSRDLTVLLVLVVSVCLCVPVFVACKRADDASQLNQGVHFLSDNSPCDQYLYAVTVHTGLYSAARMSAKVYIVLIGEDGVSQTRELQVPGSTLFRRNTEDTFIISAADHLGPVWGVHIWHDNSGPSPYWYLKQVEVSELNSGSTKGHSWLFIAQCWLAVNKGDGRVERKLQVCHQGIGFTKMFRLKLSDYLADHHIWLSLHSCPCPSTFTRAQRLSVSLLLLLGYSYVNTLLVSQMDNQVQLLFDSGIIDVSALSVRTGLLSVVAVVPAAAIMSFLFRLREVEQTGSRVQHAPGRKTEKDLFDDTQSWTDSIFEPHLSWSNVQQQAQEAWRKKYQGTDFHPLSPTILQNKLLDKTPIIHKDVVLNAHAIDDNMRPELQNVLPITEGCSVNQAPQGKEFDVLSESSRFHEGDGGQATRWDKDQHSRCYDDIHRWRAGGIRPVSHYLAWTLCLLLSLSCLVLSAVLGMRFSSSQVLLWIHSLFVSLVSCLFFIQPAVILIVAAAVSFWHRKSTDFHTFSNIGQFEVGMSKLRSKDEGEETCAFPRERDLEKLLRARQRARYIRHVRPPTPAELRRSRGTRRRESLIHKTLRELFLCGSMLILVLCMNYSSSFSDHHHLNKAVRKHYVRGHDNAFLSIQKHADWWAWVQTSLLTSLYKNTSDKVETHILIGEPVLWKTEESSSYQCQASGTVSPDCLHLYLSGSRASTYPQSSVSVPMATPPRTYGLGCSKSDAASKLTQLRSGGWLGRQTVAVRVQFTLFSPAPNLFTGVTLLIEQSPTGVLLPSARVQSVRVYHRPAMWDYVVMVCQLLYLLFSLLQLCIQVHSLMQQGMMGYSKGPCNWLEASLLTVTLVYYFYYIYHSVIVLEVVELLQRHNHRGHVDVSGLAAWEQCIRTLRGVLLFLLTVKCVTVLRVNKTMTSAATLLTRSLSSLFWPMISLFILVLVLSCVGNLLFMQSSWAFSSLSYLHRTLLHHYRGHRAVRGLLLTRHDLLYRGVLYLSSMVGTATAICAVSSLVRKSKRIQKTGNVFTVAELANYIRLRVSEITGRQRQAWIENHAEGKTYHFEEFESLVDELLFRLNALSDSLHHTLPPKAHRYSEEDTPVVSPLQEMCNMDAQELIPTQNEETMVTDHTDVNSNGETISAFHLLRSTLKLEEMQLLQQKDKTRAGGKLIDRELQVLIQAENNLLVSPQAAHTEVVVEVLVHEEPHKHSGVH